MGREKVCLDFQPFMGFSQSNIHRKRYYELRDEWCGIPEVFERQDVLEERHRIDVDCRRTDRTISLFAQPPASPEDKTASARYAIVSPQDGEIGAQSPSNEHTEQLAAILLTYGFYEKELGEYGFTFNMAEVIHCGSDGLADGRQRRLRSGNVGSLRPDLCRYGWRARDDILVFR